MKRCMRRGESATAVAIAKACDKIQGQFTSAPCSITQKAGEAALLGDLTPSFDMVKQFKIRRDIVYSLLKEIPPPDAPAKPNSPTSSRKQRP